MNKAILLCDSESLDNGESAEIMEQLGTEDLVISNLPSKKELQKCFYELLEEQETVFLLVRKDEVGLGLSELIPSPESLISCSTGDYRMFSIKSEEITQDIRKAIDMWVER